jgi:PAS domain S-box-containing protein
MEPPAKSAGWRGPGAPGEPFPRPEAQTWGARPAHSRRAEETDLDHRGQPPPAAERCGDACWTILDSINDGVFTVDASWRITSFNHAAEALTGWSRDEAIGRHCYEVFRANICQGSCALRRTMESGETLENVRVDVLDRQGRRVPISVSTAILRSPAGEPLGGVETFRDLSAVEELRRQLEGSVGAQGIVGQHRSLRRIMEMVPDVAASDATVLIGGPSGSGKGLLAEAIHRLSGRAQRRFVKVSCAALPETLLESELFGHVKGAFTDARHARAGRIAQAQGGTLFLDEIGDVPLAVQVKLLRVLQEREYEPVGSDRTQRADVRVIAATNKDLRALIREGRFREDLYYRLAVVEIGLPGLSERREDIPLLVDRFVARHNALTGRTLHASDEAMAALIQHDWPGNVRELENAVERAFVLCHSGAIELRHLPEAVARPRPRREAAEGGLSPLDQAEAHAIREVLGRCEGNRIRAAGELGMHRSTLYRKLLRYRIG